MANQFESPDFKLASRAFLKLTGRLPKQIGAVAEQFFKESFENQGFSNNTLVPWKGTRGGKSNAFGSKSSGILIGSGTLKRSISFAASKGYVEVSVDGDVVPYAKIHNEGGMVTFPIHLWTSISAPTNIPPTRRSHGSPPSTQRPRTP